MWWLILGRVHGGNASSGAGVLLVMRRNVSAILVGCPSWSRRRVLTVGRLLVTGAIVMASLWAGRCSCVLRGIGCVTRRGG